LLYRRSVKVTSIIIIITLIGTSPAQAICRGRFLNPITDICWQCLFPVKIGGIEVFKGPPGLGDPPEAASNPICVCPLSIPPFFRIGITTSFWDPTYIIETTKDPGCFPSLGFEIGGFFSGLEGMTSSSGVNEETFTFAQANLFLFAVWKIMSIFIDTACMDTGISGLDLAYTTIVDPTWQSDVSALIIAPEALVFANPVAQASCVADSIAANAGYPLPPLFHCMGSFGSAYPLTGHMNHDDYVQSNAAIASRLIYKLSRQGQIWDAALSPCYSVPTPIWIKWNYRLQPAIPVRGESCFPIGRSGLTWGSLKNPPLSPEGDNFAFIIFRKRLCCAF